MVSLRSFLLRHPPVVTFVLCVVTLSLTFLALGENVRTQPVTDIDFTQEWGDILRVLGEGKICAQRNDSRDVTTTEGTRTESPEDSANVSVLITIIVSPWQLAVNHSNLQITVTGVQLGMNGPGADAPLTITLTSYWLSDQCNTSEEECAVKFCLRLTGPQELLPQSTGSPQCPVNGSEVPEVPVMSVLETEPNASTACFHLSCPERLNVISKGDAVLLAQRLYVAGLSLLFLGILCLFLFCLPLFKDKKTGGPL